MLRRVTQSVLGAPHVSRVVILAQNPECLMNDDMADFASDPRVTLCSGQAGIADSVAAIAGTPAAPWPVLVTTADHALLTPAIVTEFLGAVGDEDLAVGVGHRTTIERAFPQTRRTWLRFSDGDYSGANLFALRNANVAPALAFWSSIEHKRKRKTAMIASFGPYLLLRAMTRSISFAKAVSVAGKKLRMVAVPITLSQPEAVIDVDKMDDLALATSILETRQTPASARPTTAAAR